METIIVGGKRKENRKRWREEKEKRMRWSEEKEKRKRWRGEKEVDLDGREIRQGGG